MLQEKSCPIIWGWPGPDFAGAAPGGRGGRRGVVSHHGAPGGGSGAENAAFSTV